MPGISWAGKCGPDHTGHWDVPDQAAQARGAFPRAGLDTDSPLRVPLLLWPLCSHSATQPAQPRHTSVSDPSTPLLLGIRSAALPRRGCVVSGRGRGSCAAQGPAASGPWALAGRLTPKVWDGRSCCGKCVHTPQCQFSWNKRMGQGACLCRRVGVRRQESRHPPAPSLSSWKTSSSLHVLLLSPSC